MQMILFVQNFRSGTLWWMNSSDVSQISRASRSMTASATSVVTRLMYAISMLLPGQRLVVGALDA